jgi:LuxR family maltose regulon positive regulatory protein
MTGQTTMPATARSSGGSLASPRARALSSTGNGGRGTVFAPKFRSLSLRPGLAGRPRLTQRLVTAGGRLVVVTAPPGSGKSTLLAQWAAADPRRFAFVSLEPSDNDPVELWNCVVTSVRQVVPSFGGVEPMLDSAGGTATGPLVRRIAAGLDPLSEPVAVVLDDYHVIGNPACHASAEALTAHPVSGNHGETEGWKHG